MSESSGLTVDGLPGFLRKWWPVLALLVVSIGWFLRVDWYVSQAQERDAEVNVALDQANQRDQQIAALIWSLRIWADGVSKRLDIPPPPDVPGIAQRPIAQPTKIPPGWADVFADAPPGP